MRSTGDQGCDTCVARADRDGHPGLARSMESAAQCCGKTFLRFCRNASASCLAAVQPTPFRYASCFAHGPVDTLSCAIPAALKPGVTVPGHPRNACVTPMCRRSPQCCSPLCRRSLHATHPASRRRPVICQRGKSRSTYTSIDLRNPLLRSNPGWPSLATRPTHALDTVFRSLRKINTWWAPRRC